METLIDIIEDKFSDYAWDWTDDTIFVMLGDGNDDPTIEIRMNSENRWGFKIKPNWDVFIAKVMYTTPTKMIATNLTKTNDIVRAVKKALKDPIIVEFENKL